MLSEPSAAPLPTVLWPILDGKVQTRSLEAHIVDHCNLRCADCCSLSPLLPKWAVDPADLERDIGLARNALQPRWFKLVGGEPLLHPAVDDCLAIARRSGLAEMISVTTNGHLLPRMSERFWSLTQALTISLYPHPALDASKIEWINRKAADHGIPLNWKRQDHFVQMDHPVPRDDDHRTSAIFAECWLRRRCHVVSGSRFYACTRPPHFQTLLGRSFLDDGVLLHEGSSIADEIREYLLRERPLNACSHCAGGHAPTAPHRQMSAAEVDLARQKWLS
jgi:hypothetical protein